LVLAVALSKTGGFGAGATGGAIWVTNAGAAADAGTSFEEIPDSVALRVDGDKGAIPEFAALPAQYNPAPLPARIMPTSTARISAERGGLDPATEGGMATGPGDTTIGGGRLLAGLAWPFFNASKIKLIEP
jgi:hypothetical protein